MFNTVWFYWLRDVGFWWICAGLFAALALWALSRAWGRARTRRTEALRALGGAAASSAGAPGAPLGASPEAAAARARADEERLKGEALEKVEALLRGAGAPVLLGGLLLHKERAERAGAELVTVLHGALWVLRVEAWGGHLRGERGAPEWAGVEWEGQGAARVERLTPRPNALRAHEAYLEVLRLVAHGKATREAQVVSALVVVGGEPRLKGLRAHERALSLPQLRAHIKGAQPPLPDAAREAAQALWRRLRQLSEELSEEPREESREEAREESRAGSSASRGRR
ncbi:MAG: hypothetical protein FJ138_01610 [Deltaproteobacteria bacterium]|nr:hypothetical protein [Deltaproteobacteria bacterium]